MSAISPNTTPADENRIPTLSEAVCHIYGIPNPVVQRPAALDVKITPMKKHPKKGTWLKDNKTGELLYFQKMQVGSPPLYRK